MLSLTVRGILDNDAFHANQMTECNHFPSCPCFKFQISFCLLHQRGPLSKYIQGRTRIKTRDFMGIFPTLATTLPPLGQGLLQAD